MGIMAEVTEMHRRGATAAGADDDLLELFDVD
jgi:hypothetical protein